MASGGHGATVEAAGESKPYKAELAEAGRHWVTAWKEVLGGQALGADVIAGITVAAVALPLNLALGVASGVTASTALTAGAIGGAIAAAFGGAPLQVTGPAAALTTMVAVIAKEHGLAGVAAATIVVGLVQLALGFGMAGKLARFVPEAVLAGFTTGVGLKLLDNQLPELFGFDYKVLELAQMMHRPHWLHEVSWLSVICGLGVAFLIVTTQKYRRFPAALVGIAIITALSGYLHWDIERVGAIPSSLPPLAIPDIADEKWIEIGTATLPLALLAAAESLLSASALDRLVPQAKPHNPNLELFGQGLANLFAGLFSGMPVTGVVVRSSVNVSSGGRTRLSSLLHGLMLLVCILALSRPIAQIPLSALAGLLLVIAFRLVEVGTAWHLVRHDRIGAVAFVVTAAGTVSGHLVMGLVGGMAIMGVATFMRRGQVEQADAKAKLRSAGIRGVLAGERGEARRPASAEQGPSFKAWLSNIRLGPEMPRSAFVHEQAAVIGRVVMGEHVHIAAGSSVRADEGAPFFIGPNSNIQDGVVIHALKEKWVRVNGEEWAVYVGRNVSIAHDALVHGPCFVGDDTFIGFKAVVHDSIVGSGCFIGIGAVVVGVEIPDGKFVPHGSIIDSADKVEALPGATEAHAHFNEDVVDVNRGLAVAYHRLRADERAGRQGGGRAQARRFDELWVPTPSQADRF